MQELIQHIVTPLLSQPDSLKLEVTEGDSSIFIEMEVHDDDVDAIVGENNQRLNAIRHLMSIASGPKKPSLEITNELGGEENAATQDVGQAA